MRGGAGPTRQGRTHARPRLHRTRRILRTALFWARPATLLGVLILLVAHPSLLGGSGVRVVDPSWFDDRSASRREWAPRNCDEARALGIAPIHRGQPGYAPHLDWDNDGIACEPLPRWRR